MTSLLEKAQGKTSESISLKDNFTKLVLICLGFTALTTLFQLITTFSLIKLATKPAPTLVQLQDGRSINVQAIHRLDRTDESIVRFVQETLTMILTWNGVIPDPNEPTKLIQDGGVTLTNSEGNIGQVTTTAWLGSYGLEMEFRTEFLKNLAELIPKSVFNQQVDVVFIPLKILPPEQLEEGRWKIRVISNLLFASGRGTKNEDLVPYNVDVYVRSVTPLDASGSFTEIKGKNPSLAQKIATIRTSALEITAITPIPEENLK